jgi:hypothetical protein
MSIYWFCYCAFIWLCRTSIHDGTTEQYAIMKSRNQKPLVHTQSFHLCIPFNPGSDFGTSLKCLRYLLSAAVSNLLRSTVCIQNRKNKPEFYKCGRNYVEWHEALLRQNLPNKCLSSFWANNLPITELSFWNSSLSLVEHQHLRTKNVQHPHWPLLGRVYNSSDTCHT